MDVLRNAPARRRILVAGIALAVALAGCSDARPDEEVRAGDAGSSRAGSTKVTDVPPGSAAGASTTTTVVVTPGTEPGQPGQVDPTPPAEGGAEPPAGSLPPVTTDPNDPRHPHGWDAFTVGADGRTLTFTYYAGVAPCSVFDSIVADEGAVSVRVTIYEHSGPEGVACIMLAQQKSASVTLGAPLGGRTVVDGTA